MSSHLINLLTFGDIQNVQVAEVGTEHTLVEETSPGVYQLQVICSDMRAGDEVELKVYSKVLSGDTAVVELFGTYGYNSIVDSPLVTTIPITTDLYIKCTLKQTAGTSKQFPWALKKL